MKKIVNDIYKLANCRNDNAALEYLKKLFLEIYNKHGFNNDKLDAYVAVFFISEKFIIVKQ